jgi:hypothetical protein
LLSALFPSSKRGRGASDHGRDSTSGIVRSRAMRQCCSSVALAGSTLIFYIALSFPYEPFILVTSSAFRGQFWARGIVERLSSVASIGVALGPAFKSDRRGASTRRSAKMMRRSRVPGRSPAYVGSDLLYKPRSLRLCLEAKGSEILGRVWNRASFEPRHWFLMLLMLSKSLGSYGTTPSRH